MISTTFLADPTSSQNVCWDELGFVCNLSHCLTHPVSASLVMLQQHVVSAPSKSKSRINGAASDPVCIKCFLSASPLHPSPPPFIPLTSYLTNHMLPCPPPSSLLPNFLTPPPSLRAQAPHLPPSLYLSSEVCLIALQTG